MNECDYEIEKYGITNTSNQLRKTRMKTKIIKNKNTLT